MITQITMKLECSLWYTIANTRFFTFDLDLGVMVTQNVAEYPSHHVTHGPESLKWLCQTVKKMYLKGKTFFDLDLGIKVTLNIAMHPLHYVTYSPAMF